MSYLYPWISVLCRAARFTIHPRGDLYVHGQTATVHLFGRDAGETAIRHSLPWGPSQWIKDLTILKNKKTHMHTHTHLPTTYFWHCSAALTELFSFVSFFFAVAAVSFKSPFAHMLLFMFSWFIWMHIFWSIQGMLSEQHCSGCTTFSNKVKETVIFFPLPKMAQRFWPVNFKGSDLSFLALIVLLMRKMLLFHFCCLPSPPICGLWCFETCLFCWNLSFERAKCSVFGKIYAYINPIHSLPKRWYWGHVKSHINQLIYKLWFSFKWWHHSSYWRCGLWCTAGV